MTAALVQFVKSCPKAPKGFNPYGGTWEYYRTHGIDPIRDMVIDLGKLEGRGAQQYSGADFRVLGPVEQAVFWQLYFTPEEQA